MQNSAVPARGTERATEDTTLSALADGELDHQETVRILETLSHGADWRARWQSYHIIGDCLRDIPPLKSGLATRISLLLADEPTILAPRRSLMARFGMPAAASLAAVMLVAWGAVNLMQNDATSLAGNQLAAASPGQPSSHARDDMNDYVAAHRDFSPGAMLASASFEVPADPAR
ncbi:membrane protein [Sulfuriferula plumbiphila]|uniref:Membrane protein n=1 Tax=Sulfuriferula plumbiphila TaxID=171865 RepID=A0A512L7C4_9PROT|nr:RseA family anti-sigma factor [Sulfuriferula plumbiphila]BBP05346.1 membrane protein [Sulfuriferula plumbiphila]GEP30383.1 membrane protein [Sulfuriferula plumbiphila]